MAAVAAAGVVVMTTASVPLITHQSVTLYVYRRWLEMMMSTVEYIVTTARRRCALSVSAVRYFCTRRFAGPSARLRSACACTLGVNTTAVGCCCVPVCAVSQLLAV